MIVNGDGQDFFAHLLPDNVLVEMFVYVLGFQEVLKILVFFLRPFLHHDFIAQFDAFITNINGWDRRSVF